MPEPLTITDITFQLGAPYIPTHIYDDFAVIFFDSKIDVLLGVTDNKLY